MAKPLNLATGPILVSMVDWSECRWFVYAAPDSRVRATAKKLKPGQMRKGERFVSSVVGESRKTALARGRKLVEPQKQTA